MHEIALMEEMLRIVEEAALTQGSGRVLQVRLEIGELSGVEIEALRFAFDAVAEGTLAAGAALHIETVPGEGWCPACSKTVRIASRLDACPACGEAPLRPVAGMDMRVKELEI